MNLLRNKILVVEDNKTCATILSELLRKRGYEVQVAIDAGEAAAKVRIERFNLIVLDLVLIAADPFSGPHWDGCELMNYLRFRKDTPVPVVVLSSMDPGMAAKKAQGIGAEACFAKPARNNFFEFVQAFLEKPELEPVAA